MEHIFSQDTTNTAMVIIHELVEYLQGPPLPLNPSEKSIESVQSRANQFNR